MCLHSLKGLKLRRIWQSDTDMLFEVHGPAAWPTPGLECRIKGLVPFDSDMVRPDNLRMRSVDCNRPGTTGYSVALSGFDVLRFHPHSTSTIADFYEELDDDPSVLWMYVPVDPGERLTEIGLIQHTIIRQSKLTVGSRHLGKRETTGADACQLVTSNGRAVACGHYATDSDDMGWKHSLRFPEGPSRIYVNEWDPQDWHKGIERLGWDATFSVAKTRRVRSLQRTVPATSPVILSRNGESWHYTFCSLDRAVEVTTCTRIGFSPPRAIVGMLIRYADGGRACVGQYRMDWPLEVHTATESSTLRIGLSHGKKKKYPHVLRVTTQELTETEATLRWMELPMRGKLEWWFSLRKAKIYHHEDTVMS